MIKHIHLFSTMVLIAYSVKPSVVVSQTEDFSIETQWVQALQGKMKYRPGPYGTEMELGIDWSSKDKPSCMVATTDFIYQIDEKGSIKHQIPLKFYASEEDPSRVFGMTLANGKYYVLAKAIQFGEELGYESYEVYDSDNILTLKISVKDLREKYKIEGGITDCRLSPKGDFFSVMILSFLILSS